MIEVLWRKEEEKSKIVFSNGTPTAFPCIILYYIVAYLHPHIPHLRPFAMFEKPSKG